MRMDIKDCMFTNTPVQMILTLSRVKFRNNIRVILNYAFSLHIFAFHISGIYILSVSVLVSNGNNYKVKIAYTFILILSFGLWYSLVFRMKRNQTLINSIKCHLFILKIISRKKHTVRILMCYLYCYPVIVAAIYAYIGYIYNIEDPFFSFGVVIEDIKLRTFIHFIGNTAYYIIFMQYPSVVALYMCLLISICGKFLIEYKRQLKTSKLDAMLVHSTYTVTSEYFKILKTLRHLKSLLSVPLCLITASSYFNLYTALDYVLRKKGYIDIYVIETYNNAFIGSATIILLTICSSKIPEFQSEIKVTAGILIQRYKLETIYSNKVLFDLDRIEKSEIISLTACGLFYFKRSFLLSAYASLFTYGLLIVNLN